MAGGLDASLLVQRSHPSDPQLSPDGSTLVFEVASVVAGATESRLWTCARDGSDLRPLTAEGGRDGGARWSPDGRWIAFASDRAGEGRSGLYVLPADGGEPRLVVDSARP